MLRRLAPIAALVLLAAPALAQMENCWAETAYPGATIMVCPAGDGPPFTEVSDGAGNVVDATITVHVVDWYGDPVVDFPAEDVWLESTQGNLAFPIGGNIADHNSDANGETVFQEPLPAGGYTLPGEGVQIYIAGSPLNQLPLDLRFNSPDINGDLVLDLADLTLFASDYLGGVYVARSDLYADGVLNLSDFARFVVHYVH